MRIEPQKTCALLIDYQEKLLPVLNEPKKFVDNTAILVKGLNELDIPIVLSEQYPKGLGATISEISTLPGIPEPIAKTTFSCILTPELYEAIRATGAKNVIVTGCEAHICVLQSVIDLLAKDFNVYLVTDCITSRYPHDKDTAIERAKQEGAYVTTYESLLFELLVKAGSDAFKVISKLIK